MRKHIWYRFISLSILVTLVISFTGCELAFDNDGFNNQINSNNTTRLNQSLDLGNQSMIQNNSDNLVGLFITIGSNVGKEKIEGTLIDKNTVKFNGIKGYFFGNRIETDENGDKTNIIMGDNVFSNSNLSVSVLDDIDETKHEITLYVSYKFNSVVYLNSVYQRDNGTYYTIGGNPGIMISNQTPETTCSGTASNTNTNTINGVTKASKVTFIVNFTSKYVANNIIIKEMNNEDKLIKKTEYMSGDPQDFIIQKNTSYIIVEDIINNTSGDTSVIRNIYSVDQDDSKDSELSHPYYISDDMNILCNKPIRFIKK